MSSWMVRLPRLRSLSRGGMEGREGDVTQRTSAPWAARQRPATGAAMTRDISRTRRPLRQPVGMADGEDDMGGGRGFGGVAGPRGRRMMGSSGVAAAWGWASHSSYERRA